MTNAAGTGNPGDLPTMPDPTKIPEGDPHLPTMPDPLEDPERGQKLPSDPDPFNQPANINDPRPTGDESEEDDRQIA